jgi:hypothetical protein
MSDVMVAVMQLDRVLVAGTIGSMTRLLDSTDSSSQSLFWGKLSSTAFQTRGSSVLLSITLL